MIQQPQPMTPEQAIDCLEQLIDADEPTHRHYGPKRVYVIAGIALATLRKAIAPKPEKKK